MKLLMIRHGEPCYANVKDLQLLSYLGELTPQGIAQAETVAKDERLQDADVIISSPFTRALQTAAIISRETQKPLIVEPAFHEILLDTSHKYTLYEEYIDRSYKDFIAHSGVRNDFTPYKWESLEHIVSRAYPAMKKYVNYNKVIVVAHATLIRSFGYDELRMPHCQIFEREFDENSKYENYELWQPNKKRNTKNI
ncbi:MAG: histidine phosphatase family protein [Clostridia bacterium]|nr:histidine phosphatase family protein [Clostridia bacterium]